MSPTDVDGRAPGPAMPDAALDRLRQGLPVDTVVSAAAADRLVRAPDASHFLLTPSAVVTASSADAVGRLMRAANSAGLHLTFRSGGTSLSGQGVTAGVLVDVRRHFRSIDVLDDGARVRVQGGATLRAVNARLAPYGRKLGPDPASEIACTIGGVVANNSSGMACGTAHNTYRTLDSLVLVLPSGTVVDSGAADADEKLRALEPELYEGLARLGDRVRGDAGSVRTIERLFAMKNTMGYGLNSFLDHTRPVDVLAHLVIGSEGTLAFVASASFRTVPLLRHAITGLLPFGDLAAATGALPSLLESAPTTVELLDATSLRIARRDPASAAVLRDLQSDDRGAALLVEYQEATPEALSATVQRLRDHQEGLGAGDIPFSADAARRADLWHVRKGIYATVAAGRPTGSIALLEDVVVPVGRLLDTCTELTGLFEQYGYRDCAIFGHAKDGNVHFMLTDRFYEPDRLETYRRFTDHMVSLILDAGGSLKAEHGTGRTMAPFVQRQYGDELYDVMREIKRLCDPHRVLSPGVVIDDDPDAHLRHLKTTPEVEDEVDRCVECGYCEPVCPSKDLTTTPRQRIVLQRAQAAARAAGDLALSRELQDAARYDVVDTCAVDGMCQTACPVHINTGDLVKRLRVDGHGSATEAVGRAAARHWGAVTRAASLGLDAAKAVPAALPNAVTRAARRVAPRGTVPLWTRDLPGGGAVRRAHGPSTADTVFFPSCVGSMFGGSAGAASAFLTLCERAGMAVSVPDGIADLCCGTPWSSKGLHDGQTIMRDRIADAARGWARNGGTSVVCDAASCTEGLRSTMGSAGGTLPVVDAVQFTAETLVPRLTITKRLRSVAVHPTCSSTRGAGVSHLLDLVGRVADEVVVPTSWGCCGMAGDRGLLLPELTASATAREAAEVRAGVYDAYVSDNRPCEIAMSRATGQPYLHALELVVSCTAPDERRAT